MRQNGRIQNEMVDFLQQQNAGGLEKQPFLTALPAAGDAVWIRRRHWRVEQVWHEQHVVRFDVASRDRRRAFLAPFDIVSSTGRMPARRVRSQHATAKIAAILSRAADVRLPMALLDAGVDILPHQIEPVLAVIAGRTRLLIADDVGLGKTIQAGLIVAELLRREPAPRILLLVPGSLRDQWAAELRRRFGIECAHGDREGLDSLARCGAFGVNPWTRAAVWISSPDFVKQRHVFEALPLTPWDLVVLDEAHAVCGDSDRYAACDTIARRGRRVLLLTATPHSGDVGRYSRLLALGNVNDDEPVVFRRTRQDLGLARTRHVRWHRVRLSAAENRALRELARFEQAVLHAAGTELRTGAQLLLSVFRKRALSTFEALSLSLLRRLAVLGDESTADLEWVQSRLFVDADQDADGQEEMQALGVCSGLDARRERASLRRLRQLALDAARLESKVTRLISLLTRTSEPVVVFSEFRDSLSTIHQRLQGLRPMSLLHGRLDASQQRSELRRYLSGESSVLLTTDVAGQGLNLQSRGRWVMSLELPWNPVRLEQRIGRVDRLGQTRPVHFSLLVARHEAEQGLLEQLSRKIFLARAGFSETTLELVIPDEQKVREALL